MKSDHYLLTPFGSLGDLHPYIAVGMGLRERGHSVTIATSEVYRAKVEGEGLRFAPVRPDVSHMIDDPERMRIFMHPRRGTEHVMRRMFLPYVEQAFEDTIAAARDADLIVSHPIAFATPPAAEYLGKRWVSVALAPSLFLSIHDPPVISGAPVMSAIIASHPAVTRSFYRLVSAVAHRWSAPIHQLRKRANLPEMRSALLRGMFSPFGMQAWFSRVFGAPQPDWPGNVTITGFPFYDKLEPGQGLTPELRAFLDSGAAPVVFTLGSSAVFDAGRFYAESMEAIAGSGYRAVLLIGRDERNRPNSPVPANVCVAEYAPYSELLPRAAATVHQGGVGTTAQAMRAGRPMIVVPWSHDQPDNANRVRKLGIAGVIPRKRYGAGRVRRELDALLSNGAPAAAMTVARELEREDGVRAACEGLEGMLRPG